MKKLFKKQILFSLFFGITILHTACSFAMEPKKNIFLEITTDQALQATGIIAGGIIGGVIGYKLMPRVRRVDRNIYFSCFNVLSCFNVAATVAYGSWGAVIGALVHKKLIAKQITL